MGCTITKVLLPDGSPSQLFQSLKESMGDSQALETYLDLSNNKDKYAKIYGTNKQGEVNGTNYKSTPKFKLPGFDNARQQKDVMDMLAEQFLIQLKNHKKTKSNISLSGINLDGLVGDPRVVTSVIQTIKNNIRSAVDSNPTIPERTSQLLLQAAEKLESYIFTYEKTINDSGEEKTRAVLGPVGNRIARGGVILTASAKTEQVESLLEEVNDDNFDAVDSELKTIERVRIYDMAILDTNPNSSILSQLKLFLSSIGKVAKGWKYSDRKPTPEYEISEVGQQRKAGVDKLYAKLSGTLKGIQSIEEVSTKLQAALKTDPQLAPIYNELQSEKPKSIIGLGEYKSLEVALYSLVKQDYNMKSIVETPSGEVVLMDANSTNVKKKVAQEWEYNIAETKKSGRGAAIIKKIDEFLKPKKIKSASLSTRLNKSVVNDGKKVYTPEMSALFEAAKLFQDAGFKGVSKEVLKELIDQGLANKELITNKKVSLTPFSIISTILRALPEKGMRSNQNIFSEDWQRGEGRSIKLLSNIVGQKKSDIVTGAFLSDKGTLTFPLNYGSAAQDTFSLMTSNSEKGKAYRDKFINDPMYANSKLMEIFTEAKNTKDLQSFTTNTLSTLTNNVTGDAVGYGEMSTFDAIVSRMNAYFSPDAKARYFNAFTPTQADRGNLLLMTVPKFNMKKDTLKATVAGEIFNSKGELVAEDVRTWVENQVRGEVNRMVSVISNPYVEGYSDRASSFTLFPALNDLGLQENLNPSNVEDIVAKAVPQAITEFKLALEKDLQYHLDNDVLIDSNGLYTIDQNFSSRYADTISKSKGLTKADIQTYLANNFIYNYESLLYTSGDPAFYSDSIKLNKRLALPFTPGVKPAVGKGTGLEADTYGVVTIAEPKVASELAELYQAVTGDSKSFNKIDIADGWGIGSLQRFQQLNAATGTHTDGSVKTINQMIHSKEGQDIDMGDSLGSKKMFYYKLQEIAPGLMGPVAQKYSLFPAIPQMFEQQLNGKDKFPTLARISRLLKKGKVSEVVVESVVKVGIHNMVDIKDIETAVPMQLSNDFVREVQKVPNDPKTESLLGSQIRKLIIANFSNEGDITLGNTDMPATEALALYNNALTTMARDKGVETVNKIIPDGVRDPELLARELIHSASVSEHQNASYYANALGISGEDGKSLLPINYPTLGFRIDNYINSSFRKAVNRLKMPGHTAVQIPSFGTFRSSDKSLQVASDLKFVRFAEKGYKSRELTGEDAIRVAKLSKKFSENPTQKLAEELSDYTVLPAEVRLTPAFYLKTLKRIAGESTRKKYGKEISNQARAHGKLGVDAATKSKLYRFKMNELTAKYEAQEYNRLLGLIQTDGKFDMKAMEKYGLDEIVVYRIPTQGKNSMLVAKVKEFLPESSGNTIQVPAEIVEQAGSDFDVDKLFIEMTDFKESEDGLERYSYPTETDAKLTTRESQSAIFDFHRGILSSPKHAAELLLPNGTSRLSDVNSGKGVLQQLGISEAAQANASVASVEAQETFRSNNQAGKNLIGVSSISSVQHAVAQHIKPKFKTDYIINGSPLTLGAVHNLAGTEMISTEIAEIQNAAVDNASEPLLGLLNINMFTASTALMLISAGHGLTYASAVLNAPVVKAVTKAYQKYERTLSPKTALENAIKEVRTKPEFKFKESLGKTLFNMSTYSQENAMAMMGRDKVLSPSDHATALEAFLQFRTLGEQLSKFQRIMNIDSTGTPASNAKLFSIYRDLSAIKGTKAFTRERSNDPLLKGYHTEIQPSPIELGSEYSNSYLAEMELQSIQKALEVNMKVSPAASKQFQTVIDTVTAKVGYLSENMQIGVLSNYNTFLATNPRSNTKTISSLSKAISKGEFNYMTNVSDLNATGNLLKEHIEQVRVGNLESNDFLDHLNVLEQDGRIYVTFMNATSRAIPGDVKEDLMNFFEDLMTSSSQLERNLADSLTKYAAIHYGFATSINSFMEFIPPIAHKEYLHQGKGATIPTVFENIQENYQDTDMFLGAEVFADMYIANNAHKLGLDSYGTMDKFYEDFNSKSDEAQTSYVGKFIRVFNSKTKDYDTFQIGAFGIPNLIAKRGVPNLVVEYHDGPSYYNNTPDGLAISSRSAKEAASEVNQVVRENLDFNGGLEILQGKDLAYSAQTINNVKELDKYVESVSAKLKANKAIPEAASHEFLMGLALVKDTVAHRAKKKENFNEVFQKTYDDIMVGTFDGVIDWMLINLC